MKIGIDGRALQQKPWGGVGQYTYHLLHALFALDQKNEYVVWYNAAGQLEVPMFEEYPNVRVHRTRWPNKVLNVAITALNAPRLEIGNWKLDIMFMPNLNFISLPSRTKLILTIHDLSFVHFPEHFSWKSRLWHRMVQPRALLHRADQIIAVSKHTKGDLVETYGIAPKKVTIIYPGTDHKVTSYKLQVTSYKPYVLYFGALEPRKNIEGLIAAYEALQPPEQLVLAGLSTPYVKQIKKRIAQSSARDKIVLKENPTEEEKHTLYAGATLFVYPSFYEGFGFPPLEAMAHGVPVVASSVSSIPEICCDAAVLVNPWKTEEIKESMRVLLEDEELRRKYTERGKARVAQFSWPTCAVNIHKLFTK